jgi:glutamate-1-semialdehyde 2,1-aminomutase
MDGLGATDFLPKIESSWDVGRCFLRDSDIALFRSRLRDWMPEQSLDIHAHVFDLRMLHPGSGEADFSGPPKIGLERMLTRQKAWFGDRAPNGGLLFAMPSRQLDVEAANRFVLGEIGGAWRGLMMIRPTDDPAMVERRVREEGWLGFKVYHLFASREDTMAAEPQEFLPEWAWEIAHRLGLLLMVHLVRSRAVADPINQQYIQNHCTRFPNARLILAHAARAFCGQHAVEGVGELPLLDNIFFDTSAVCDPHAFQAILQRFGPGHLIFGTDFPISETRGRPVSVGDGFYWLYEQTVDWSSWKLGNLTLTGIESLLALRIASDLSNLVETDLERIFRGNACMLIG